MLKKISSALISVSDKENLKILLDILKRYKVKIISSGGTYKSIKRSGFKCKEVSEFTGFDEMLDGRVKTLHPKIHSGILFNRKKNSHKKQMKKKKFEPIDLVVVNFYPFQDVLNTSSNNNKIIENIDIGGPSMVRAAAKNFNDVVIITDKKDYSEFKKELKKYKGRTSLNFREKLASKAFNSTAYYDSIVAEWYNQKLGIKFPDKKTFFGKKLINYDMVKILIKKVLFM